MRPVLPIAFMLLGTLSGAQSSAPTDHFSITLERGPCEGFCPWYSVSILCNGSVRYEGQAYVHIKGVRKYAISASEVHKLIQKLRDEDLWHWTEKTDLCLDYPEVKIKGTLNGQYKQVIEGCDTPGKVLELADEIDRISGSKRWVGKVR